VTYTKNFLFAVACLGPATLFFTPASHASSNDYEKAGKILTLPYSLAVTADGKIKADSSQWKIEKEGDGTELFTSIKTPQARAAVLRNSGGMESFTAYILKGPPKGSDVKPENASAVFFDKGKLSAITLCEDTGEKDSFGRTCVTATPKLCQTLHKAETVAEETIKEIDLFEMRALATILTLRGPDHQLENVVRAGNRLGLKSSLQTTKGQLMALSHQVAKEVEHLKSKDREPASDKKQTEKKIVSSAETSKTEMENEAKTRTQLERSIPKLRQACLDTGFM
jgi:hypothetical protein